MKFRSGFVSNSSSSSFICDICGHAESGYDDYIDLASVGMCTCQNGHTFCNDHITDEKLRRALFNLENKFEYNGDLIVIYDLDPKYCPICSGHRFIDSEVIDYMKVTNKYDSIIDEMKTKFEDRFQLKKFVKEKKLNENS